ncbi:VOC family protein [Parasphingorhabdus sp.]|uniref:VOC family protein n=1 Tax=Parasphingorhabdus sp. TaxID=2709688 RepID=UPI003A8F7FD5
MAIGQHYQNAYVTRDVDKAVAGFRQWADTRLILETEVEVKLWTPEGEGTGVQKLAFVWVEDLNYELIEPKSGDVLKIYQEGLPEGDGLAFHHVCHRVDDWDETMAHIEKNPFPVVLKGGTPDMLQFCYVDTREWLGHFTEYIWANPERWQQLGGR